MCFFSFVNPASFTTIHMPAFTALFVSIPYICFYLSNHCFGLVAGYGGSSHLGEIYLCIFLLLSLHWFHVMSKPMQVTDDVCCATPSISRYK